MNKVLLMTAVSPLIVVAAWVGASPAQIPIPMCPPEVASAKAMLNAKGSDLQASRSQDIQAPRNQQAVQASRSEDVQAPRISEASASTTRTAQALVREAEAACQAGDTAQASEKALAALELMKR